jgi:N,N'-diacetyllegionaminate synthase
MTRLYTVAEIGQAHDGSLGMAHSYIDNLAKTGINAIKFQIHIAEVESSVHEEFRVNFSYSDKTRYDYWKRIQFSFDEWVALKKHCDDLNLEFIATPCSLLAIDWLEKLNVKTYKVGSADTNNSLLLEKLSSLNKKVILSTGLSDFNEIENAVNMFSDRNLISILQCTSEYPTNPKTWGLNNIKLLKEKFQTEVGFSDHSGDIFACLAAHSLGAEILEFHAVYDKRMFGPDAASSLTIDEISHLVNGLNQINISLNNPLKKTESTNISNVKKIFSRSLSINKNLYIGHILSIDDFETKKPSGYGININEYKNIIGKRLIKNKKSNDFLNFDDIE